MDPTVALILGVLWVLMNLFAGRKKTPPPGSEPDEPPQPDRVTSGCHPAGRLAAGDGPARVPAVAGECRDARHGARLESPLAAEEDIEEQQSLESEPQVVSLEQEVRRPARQAYTQDADAEQLVQRRATAAAARDTGSVQGRSPPVRRTYSEGTGG